MWNEHSKKFWLHLLRHSRDGEGKFHLLHVQSCLYFRTSVFLVRATLRDVVASSEKTEQQLQLARLIATYFAVCRLYDVLLI